MINNYLKIIDQLKEEIISSTDELEEDSFTLGDDFFKFNFRTDDNLVYNEKNSIAVCVISLSSITKRKKNYYPNFKLRGCFYEIQI